MQDERWSVFTREQIVEKDNPGFFKKANLYDFLKENPGTIQVKIFPFPDVVPALSKYDEKYVRSTPNDYTHDNLLDLPRE